NGRSNGATSGPGDAPEGFLSLLSFPSDGGGEWEEPIVPPPVEVPAFPLAVFPAPLAGLCRAASARMCVPEDCLGAMAGGVAAGAAGQATTLALRETWEEAPNLFIAVVGDPGSKKSPALKMMARPLWDIDEEMWAESRVARGEWQERKKAADK